MKSCYRCGVVRPVETFGLTSKGAPRSYCRECNNALNKAQYDKRKTTPEFITKRRQYAQHNRQNNKRIRATMMWHSSKNGAKRRGIEYAIEKETLFMLFNFQGWKCIRTGIDFDLRTDMGNLPFGPSVDRIDSSKGYVLGNIQLVCNIYNYAKNIWSDDDVLTMARMLIDKADRNR